MTIYFDRLCSIWKWKIILMKNIFWHGNMFIMYSGMSKASDKTVHTRVITYKYAIYFQVYYFPSHLMNMGGKEEKLG